jgi:D-serine deaminase-like pyridoxal phosphate-dependent protein
MVAAVATAALALAATGASATAMTATLGAHLSGMGDKGTVTLKVNEGTGKLCWAFDIPTLKGTTRATINTGTTATVLVELGMDYTKSGCEKESTMTLEHLVARPAAYSVWVDTKAHPGDLRGTLSTGPASM